MLTLSADPEGSDTQMSLLLGFPFANFCAIPGIPLGCLADSRSRRGLIAAGVVAWNVMTPRCAVWPDTPGRT